MSDRAKATPPLLPSARDYRWRLDIDGLTDDKSGVPA
jgi:hypothetical protein